MVVYVEYVFLENMLLDFTLLLISLKAVKEKIRFFRLFCSAVLGGLFAVVFPFISINEGGRYALKLLFGAFMCILPFLPIKGKKEWGRYALCIISFYFCTFFFAGMLTFFKAEKFWIWIEFIFACVFFISAVFAFYQKRKKEKFLYPCRIFFGSKSANAVGYYDSGNLAFYQSLPVCLLSPELAYFLFDLEKLSTYDSMEKITIQTLGGNKRAPVFLGEILIKGDKEKKKVYFAVVGNMVSREHKLILHSKILEKDG